MALWRECHIKSVLITNWLVLVDETVASRIDIDQFQAEDPEMDFRRRIRRPRITRYVLILTSSLPSTHHIIPCVPPTSYIPSPHTTPHKCRTTQTPTCKSTIKSTAFSTATNPTKKETSRRPRTPSPPNSQAHPCGTTSRSSISTTLHHHHQHRHNQTFITGTGHQRMIWQDCFRCRGQRLCRDTDKGMGTGKVPGRTGTGTGLRRLCRSLMRRRRNSRSRISNNHSSNKHNILVHERAWVWVWGHTQALVVLVQAEQWGQFSRSTAGAWAVWAVWEWEQRRDRDQERQAPSLSQGRRHSLDRSCCRRRLSR